MLRIDQKESVRVSRHPHIAGQVLVDNANHCGARYSEHGLHRGDLSLVDDIETDFGANPNAPLAIFMNLPNDIAGETILAVEYRHAAAVARVNSGAVCSDPQDTFPVFDQRPRARSLKTLRWRNVLNHASDIACLSRRR